MAAAVQRGPHIRYNSNKLRTPTSTSTPMVMGAAGTRIGIELQLRRDSTGSSAPTALTTLWGTSAWSRLRAATQTGTAGVSTPGAAGTLRRTYDSQFTIYSHFIRVRFIHKHTITIMMQIASPQGAV